MSVVTIEQRRQAAAEVIQGVSEQHFIAGELVRSSSGTPLTDLDPARRVSIGRVAAGSAKDVAIAVKAAEEAFASWSRLTPRERGSYLSQCAARLRESVALLADLLTLETGKAIRTESRIEAQSIADVFAFYAGLGSELKGQTVPFSDSMLVFTLREPVGVVGAIIPWNVPIGLMAHKIAPALLAGNTVVVKPSEEASLVVVSVAVLLGSILPRGVLNVVCGKGEEAGAALVAHERVRKITFTGSTATGRVISAVAGARLVPVTMELGGKSPMIICADADIDAAVDGIVTGMRFTRQGQSCSAASRVFVDQRVFAQVRELLLAKLATLVIGDPLAEATDIGSIISELQYDKVASYVDEARKMPGVEVVTVGAAPTEPPFCDGWFAVPTIVFGADNKCRLAQEEIFGPVCLVLPFTDYRDALSMANGSEFGLAAYIWTNDLSRALDFSRNVAAGFVQVNQNIVFQPGTPYGGFRQSGLGREACLEAVLEHYTRQKTVLIRAKSV